LGKECIAMIHVNYIASPRTGGEYVYRVIYDELKRQGYRVINISKTELVEKLCRCREISSPYIRSIASAMAEIPVRLYCYLASIHYLRKKGCIVVTSSSPGFPVFGDITYHQPFSGVGFWKERIKLTPRNIVMRYLDTISAPLWGIAKHRLLHISNSRFTARLVKRIHGVNSVVIYPPVPAKELIRRIRNKTRHRNCVLVTRLTYEGGALLLPLIAKHLPRNVKIRIIGRIDNTGKNVLRELKKISINHVYLGFVDEETKQDLLGKCNVFLHLGVNEPFGIAVVEAMSAGLIPVAHRSGAIPEYMPRELTYVYPEEAAQKIAQIIETSAVNLDELRNSLRNRALGFDEEIFRAKIAHIIKLLAETKQELSQQ